MWGAETLHVRVGASSARDKPATLLNVGASSTRERICVEGS